MCIRDSAFYFYSDGGRNTGTDYGSRWIPFQRLYKSRTANGGCFCRRLYYMGTICFSFILIINRKNFQMMQKKILTAPWNPVHIWEENGLYGIPVSYTHLDVYKRQVSDCLTTIIDFADDKVCELTETSKHTAVLTVSVSLLLSIGIISVSYTHLICHMVSL